MLSIAKTLQTSARAPLARALATVGPNAKLVRAGNTPGPSDEWKQQNAARKTPFDAYAFAYVACVSRTRPEHYTRQTQR